MIFNIYVTGAIITFMMFAYSEYLIDDGMPWYIGAVAVVACAVVWPLTWLAVIGMHFDESENDDEQES